MNDFRKQWHDAGSSQGGDGFWQRWRQDVSNAGYRDVLAPVPGPITALTAAR
jgi:hypothetical protein